MKESYFCWDHNFYYLILYLSNNHVKSSTFNKYSSDHLSQSFMNMSGVLLNISIPVLNLSFVSCGF